jgi:hypothetical protein
VTLGGLALGTLSASLGGCAAYANYPPLDGDVAVHSPNVPPMPQVVLKAFQTVIEEYPIDGDFVINPPKGTDFYKAEKMVEEIVTPGAHLVGEESAGLPAYHATRVWVRGDGAEVDVVRPVAWDGGQSLNQTVTVRMKRKYGGWVVTSTKPWAIIESEPELFGWEP